MQEGDLMQYETAAQMAERLGVTIRTVQLWAKNERLPGVIKQGRDYLIPAGLKKPGKNGYSQAIERIPLPFTNTEFIPGTGLEYIENIVDPDSKHLAKAEYYFYTGQAQLAADATEVFFNHPDVIIKLSACLIYSFSHMVLGNTHLCELGLNCIRESLYSELSEDATPQFKAACILVATTASVLMHEEPPKERLTEYIKYLPRGLQLLAGYVLSHKAFLDKNYEWGMGIVDTLSYIPALTFPIPMIYLHISAAMNLMALKKIDEAKMRFCEAWKLAEKDGFIEPFAEHNGLLCGLVENCLKSDYPQKYKEIEEISIRFSGSWRKIHNARMNDEVTVRLTTVEFAIAMLANRGWSNIEIADYMGFSLHTVKRYISIIYQKLGISSRSELKKFIHQ